MSQFLASVSNITEALLALEENIDIIDLKQPASGALGALPIVEIREIVRLVNRRKIVSATIGDLPMQTKLIVDAAAATAQTGVDYVKIGFFPQGDWQMVIAGLAALCQQGVALVAVLFADQQPDLSIIPRLQQVGFQGVMLDTMDKQRGGLISHMTHEDLQAFLSRAKKYQLLSGLAGSLKIPDIPGLLPLQPDYLGFRGGLCDAYDRSGQLNRNTIKTIRTMLAQV